MQQQKAANAADANASAQSGMSAKSIASTSGAALTMSGRASSEESTPKSGRRRAKAQSDGKEPQTAHAGRPRPGADQNRKTAGAPLKPKKGQSAAASTRAPEAKKTAGKPGRPAGRGTQRASQQATTQEDAIALLQRDHRTVEQLFSAYEAAQSTNAKEELAQQICMELIIHAHLEEEIFYPACRENGVEDDALDEAQVEHDGAKVMIGELLEGSPDDPYYDAKVKVLKEYIRHHVNEEEKADGIFSKARQASLDLEELGTELKSMKEELTAEGDAVAAAPLEAPSLQLNNINTYSEETQMPRQSRYEDDEDDYRSSQSRGGGRGRSNMDRDDQGRFMSDDDEGGSSRGRSSRSRYDEDEDDDRGGRSRQGRGRSDIERDDQGRFMSDDDDDRGGRGRSSRGRSNMDRDDQGRFMSDDDEDDDGGRSRSSSGRGRGHGQGGWFGDSEGHAQAARQRGSSRSSRSTMDDDEDDDRGGRSRGGSGRGHGRGGWFGDSEGHSQARQQGQSNFDDDEDDDRGGRSRGGSQGGRGKGSRGRGGHGHGGWFGDSRGHSQAARRGWRDRD